MTNNRKTGKGREENTAQKITTFLTFNDQAEEAVKRYVSIFKNSRILGLVRGEEGGPIAKGQVLNATFELDGARFMAMDGGPYFTFAQGTSLFVSCETQEEIDRLWEQLSEGGEQQPCGWLKDKFGVSWQIVPSVLGEMMGDSKSGNSAKVMEALLKMSKIEPTLNGSEGRADKGKDRDIREGFETEDPVRADLPGVREGSLGTLDDKGGPRILVGPRRIHHDGPQARPPPRGRIRICHDGDPPGLDRGDEGDGASAHERGSWDVYRGHAAAPARVHDAGRLHPGRRTV